MSRYIDANMLKDKTTRINHIWNCTTNAEGKGLGEIIDDIPTVDVVEVVRCKDCIHNHTKSWNQGKRDNPSCHFTDLIRSNEFYCGFGERAES